tara:strand:- start:153 stop:545 length:393 start_codon:yes stop_codon:yes gene_type:complete
MMRVEVYWNLHKKCWSVRHKGKVIAHQQAVDLKDVTWVVQPAGNARVRREKRKNVHAFARGTLMEEGMIHYYGDISNANRAFYLPYEYTTFRRGFALHPLTKSNYARLATLTNYTTNQKKPRAYAIGADK